MNVTTEEFRCREDPERTLTKLDRAKQAETTRSVGDVAGRTGLEPATSGVTGRCSNRLNYRPARTVLRSISQNRPRTQSERLPLSRD